MNRSVTAIALSLALSLLAGCGWFGDKTVDVKKDWTPLQFYNAAKEELESGNWGTAIKLYEQLEAKYPFGRFAQQAQIETAYAYYKDNETAQCVTVCDRFMKQFPNHPNLDYVLYLKGLANFKEDLGMLTFIAAQDLADRDPKAARESFEVFKELVQRFPDSRYAADARLRMLYLVDALARHEVHVAQYYIRRGAYLAAINRAQTVITRYPNSPERRAALDVMVIAYDRMNMPEMRDDTRKILAKNFPEDRLAEPGSTTPWWRLW
jgi:outer membrane protein assembly factor BamD